MIPYYKDYQWKGGKPLGLQKTALPADEAYRIVSDPYYKWITIEAYRGAQFAHLVYDSRFLDFRKLTPEAQAAWRRETIKEGEAWIFNEDDRLILREVCHYENEICHAVQIYSPYNMLICQYKMEEGPLGPLFLFDSNNRCVMSRTFDANQNKFEECWDFQSKKGPLQ